MKGHLEACRSIATGNPDDCRCKDEENHYFRLSKWSFGLFVFELLTGFITGSLALIADSVHVFLDSTESFINAFVSRWSRQGESSESIIRDIGGKISAVLLFVLAAIIIREGWERWEQPETVSGWAFTFALIGLVLNVVLKQIHARAHPEHKNITHGWQNLHFWSDILTSIAVVIGTLVMASGGPYSIDGVLSMFIGAWIAFLTLARLAGVNLRIIGHSNNHSGHHH